MEDYIDKKTGHAWRTVTVTNEYHDIPEQYDRHVGRRISLYHRTITTLASGTDKIEVWDGSSWVEWVANKTEGRESDYWVDYEEGIIYLMAAFTFHKKKAVRVTYRYGESSVPDDIKHACALLVAAQIISSDDRSNMLAETGDPTRMAYDTRASRWKGKAEDILANYKEFASF